MAIKQTLIDFSKALKSAIQVQKNVTDIAADYIDKLSDENFDGVTPEEMEEVTGDLDDLTTTAKTNLVAAINEIDADLNKGSVSVTGDGVKDYTALLNELFALIDATKVSNKTVLKNNKDVYQIAKIQTDGFSFTNTEVTSTYYQLTSMNLSNTGSTLIVSRTTTSATSINDYSASVVTLGNTIEIIY